MRRFFDNRHARSFSYPDVLAALFRTVYGRDSEADEMSQLVRLLETGTSLPSIISMFLRSGEYKQKEVLSASHLDSLPSEAIELSLPPAEKLALWQQVAKVWSGLGVDDPYWSVITLDEYHMANMDRQDRIEEFYQSGQGEVDRFESYLQRNGAAIPDDATWIMAVVWGAPHSGSQGGLSGYSQLMSQKRTWVLHKKIWPPVVSPMWSSGSSGTSAT